MNNAFQKIALGLIVLGIGSYFISESRSPYGIHPVYLRTYCIWICILSWRNFQINTDILPMQTYFFSQWDVLEPVNQFLRFSIIYFVKHP